MNNSLKVVNHLVCLFSEAFEVIEQIRNAPESPVTSYLPAKVRHAFRRNARQSRRAAKLFNGETRTLLLLNTTKLY